MIIRKLRIAKVLSMEGCKILLEVSRLLESHSKSFHALLNPGYCRDFIYSLSTLRKSVCDIVKRNILKEFGCLTETKHSIKDQRYR